jgi:hypothetical protein
VTVSLLVWWVAAGLAFVGTVLLALGAAWGKEWPAKAYDFVGMMILAWGVAVAVVSGLIELFAWWT